MEDIIHIWTNCLFCSYNCLHNYLLFFLNEHVVHRWSALSRSKVEFSILASLCFKYPHVLMYAGIQYVRWLDASARTGQQESLLCCQHREMRGTCVQSVPWQHPHILGCAGRGSWDYYQALSKPDAALAMFGTTGLPMVDSVLGFSIDRGGEDTHGAGCL